VIWLSFAICFLLVLNYFLFQLAKT